jgi:hypothetical protein
MVDTDIARAERELKDAEDVWDEQAIQQATSVLEGARKQRASLVKESMDQIELLKGEVRKVRADEQVKGVILQRAKAAVTAWW